jgi:large subunit ribosomal protein L1
MKRSKRYKEAVKLVDEDKTYNVKEAVEIIKKMPHVKFDETLDVNTKLIVDPKQSDQMVRGSVVLPNGTGKTIRIAVFCESEKESAAKESGADVYGGQDLVDKILTESWFEFDYCVATPGAMKFVSKLGRVLGPKGLMPSPKTGNVTENIAYAVKEAKRGKIDFRVDKIGCMHVGVGKLSFSQEALVENINSYLEALVAAKPSGVKGDFIQSVFLSSTMWPSLRITF